KRSEPAQDLGFRGDGLCGHATSESSVSPRGFAKLSVTHPDHFDNETRCRSCSMRRARAAAGAEWGRRWDAWLLAEDRRLAELANRFRSLAEVIHKTDPWLTLAESCEQSSLSV